MTIQVVLAIVAAALYFYSEKLIFVYLFCIFLSMEMLLSVKRRWLGIKEWLKARTRRL